MYPTLTAWHNPAEAAGEVRATSPALEIFRAACDAMAETDVTGLLGNVTVPTLVLHGAGDCLTPLDASPDGAGARATHEGIAGSELYVLDGCGHGVLFERADEAVTKVITVLAAG